jgi:hypothetical protein
MNRYLFRRVLVAIVGRAVGRPDLDATGPETHALQRSWGRREPQVAKEVRRPGFPDMYRVTRILPNAPN